MRRSKITAIVSDLHFDAHDPPTWRAFRAWHAAVRPAHTVILGDAIDFGMLSNYAQHANAADRAIPQIRMFVDEANALALECKLLTIVEGNHDERWAKLVGGPLGSKLRGAIGLSLQEQCRFQGLDARAQWRVEDVLYRGVQEGPFLLRHGHKQAGRFGVKHIAAARLSHTMGDSEIIGHHHRVQMMCQTSGGRTAVSIANGHMAGPQDYCVDANWQRGFTVIERFDDRATAYPVIIDGGVFAWGGRVYDGGAEQPARAPDPPAYEAPAFDVDLSGLEDDAPQSAIGAHGQALRLVTAWGQTKMVQDWARQSPVHATTIVRRIVRGWTAEDAITKPSEAGKVPIPRHEQPRVRGKFVAKEGMQ